jgi:putative component of toxin-antitoxin plasmid stabilization module
VKSKGIVAASLFRAALEKVVVRVTQFGDAKQVTEIIEMRLRSGALGERVILPSGDEFFGSHGACIALWLEMTHSVS